MRSLIDSPARSLGLTVTDFFSGAGGSSEGLRQAGYRIDACANHWETAVDTHRLNHPDTEHHLANLHDADMRRFPRTTLLWASPSCVWHTPAGGRKKLPVDEEMSRNDAGALDRATAFAVIAAAEAHGYEAVIVENVPEFADWVLYQWWLDGMRALGYRAQTAVLDAAHFGAPQRRRRWFGVFTRGGVVDLTPPPPEVVPAAAILEADPGARLTRRLYVSPQIDQIAEIDVPHLVMYRRNARPRRADQHPLATITAGGNHHGLATVTSGGVYHRMLTNRECARAQGFSDDYQFLGTAKQVKRQIGNAVPVPVARWLGQRVAQALADRQAAA
ncbi:DNA cytosine methyltransferase [Mycolicibacterium chlorophenolicum]|uniref:DNA (cytosine-5-)-methyltransferase n=1 Tax=Mycolicibacterium chlorophenolicum TaxID=37916 RepID=A0A0J6WIN1_9MYCO|nr:DNA cytosine methyltransferase [Mycolicibacterium chlorophenolicum]KMO82459.1 Modification methylase BspRI [Mycolicibacterium chlorophenolicum]